jgi:methionyl-tRNA formyltransferase
LLLEMRIVFFGSPEFALPSLEALLETEHDVVAVVTQPDRPAGRGHASTPPPVKITAEGRGVRVFQPQNVSDAVSVEELQNLEPDIFVVAAYGQILRQRLLDVPQRGSLNVHSSLLPKHRGAAPVQAAILAGDDVTGVTIMEVVRALDAGPIVAQAEELISPHDTAGTLEPKLARAGARLLTDVLNPWAEGSLQGQPQDESLVTYAPQTKRDNAKLDWSMAAMDLWRRVRAFNPWPMAFTTWHGEELRILEAWPLERNSGAEPGTVLPTQRLPQEVGDEATETFVVQTGSGRLAIRQLQRPGRRSLSGPEFLRGQRDLIGSRFGE